MKAFFAVCALAFVVSPVEANWQYTKWGMTPAQAIAASGGKLAWRTEAKADGSGTTTSVRGSYKVSDTDFEAYLDFGSNGLNGVTLDTKSCSGLLTNLRSKYGDPLTMNGEIAPIVTWDDKNNGNRVKLDDFGSDCMIFYRPIKLTLDGL